MCSLQYAATAGKGDVSFARKVNGHLGIWRLSFSSLICSLNSGQVERATLHSHLNKFHCQSWNELVIQLLLSACLHFTDLHCDE